MKNAYFGEQHLHTAYSLDAYVGGARIMPADAYRFAKGETVEVGGVKVQLAKPGAPAEVILTVDGKEAARTTVKRTVPAAFTASETFDVGVDLGSPVSLDYFDRRPFKFDGTIQDVLVELK